MARLIFNEPMQRYVLTDVGQAEVMEMQSLRWVYQGGAWSTASPFYAAPFWRFVHPDDTATSQRLWPFAWNYSASFADKPLPGTGVDQILVPRGAPKPFDFQIAGVQLAARQKATLIADDMGLGKSSQAIGVANIRQPQRVLIGCPAFLSLNWADELVKWCTYSMPITILDKPRKSIPDRGFVILPYSRAASYWTPLIASGRWGLTILDEIHYLKGEPGTARIRPFFGEENTPGVIQASDQIVGLTGTPIPNAPHEMYNVLSSFRPDIMSGVSRNHFKEMYTVSTTFKSGKAKGQNKVVGAQYENALNAELRSSGLMVRRLKDQVLTQLPPKVMNLVQLPATNAVADLVQQEANFYEMLEMKMFQGQTIAQIAGHIAQVRAELGRLKAPQIAQYTWDLVENGQDRVVCFMWHTSAIDEVANALRKKGNRVAVHVVDGRTPMAKRHAIVREFQQDGGIPQIIIGQIKAAGVGLTMTKASHMVMGECSWTNADNQQAIDRIHRISQTKQVTAHILTYPHSADVKVIKANATKAIVAENVLDKNLSIEFEKIEGVYELAA